MLERKMSCSFCKRDQAVVDKLLAGPDGAYICDACVEACNRILAAEANAGGNTNPTPPSP